MKLQYDAQADAAYLRLSDAEVVDSEEVRPGLVVDFDAQDRVIGIEILHVRKTRPDVDPGRLEAGASGWESCRRQNRLERRVVGLVGLDVAVGDVGFKVGASESRRSC